MSKLKGKTGKFLYHKGCNRCGSRNNVSVYSCGYEACHTPGCGYFHYTNDELETRGKEDMGITNTQPIIKTNEDQCKEMIHRNISKQTSTLFGYATTTLNGMDVEVAPYYNKAGYVIGQKVRDHHKNFKWLGQSKEAMPFGYHLWKPKNKAVIIVEGEIDSMSVRQVMGDSLAVFGLPNGAGPQSKAYIKQHLNLFDQFETVYIGLDNDDAGHIAQKEIADLLIDKNIRLVSWAQKDPNDSLILDRGDEIKEAITTAKRMQFDGIIDLCDIDAEDIIDSCKPGFSLGAFPKLENKLKWLKHGAIYTVAAHPKAGKSTFTRTLAYDLIHKGVGVGALYLEDSEIDVAKEFLAIHKGIPSWQIDQNLDIVGGAEGLVKELQYFKDKGLKLWSHKGQFDPENVLRTLKIMRKGLGCDIIILDNLSISTSTVGDDLAKTNQLVADIVKLCQETGLTLINVVHLKKNTYQDKGVDSNVVNASDVYGTGALNKFSTALLALERQSDKQAAQLKVISNRTTGLDGYADLLEYDQFTGRLIIR